MDNEGRCRSFVCILVVFTMILTGSSTATINAVSACHGTQNANCDFFTMTCEQGTGIRVLDMLYGYKDYSCRNSENRCFETETNRKGCCVYNDSDCQESFVPLHAYSLYHACSIQETCTRQAPNVILSDCEEASTYVYVTYECVPFTDDFSIGFCDNRTIFPAGHRTSLVFRESTNQYGGPTCSCRISTLLSNITTTFVDIRMFRPRSGTGSECSSARLISDPDSGLSTSCSSNTNEEDNFVYGEPFFVNGDQLKITLTDLNKDNDFMDVPEVVWILVEGALRIDCSSSDLPAITTEPVTLTLPVTSPGTTENVNNTGTSDASSGGNTAVIAGVVAGILVVALVVGVCVFIYFKRRRKGPKRKMARQNSYTAASSVRSASNDIYDEINDVEPAKIYDPVYEPRKGEPVYDPVYEPSLKNGANGSAPNSITETHTYQNVGKGVHRPSTDSTASETKGRFVIPKRLKAPFSRVKKQTDRFVDFIKSRKGQESANTKQRPREESGGSYDHLRIGGVTLQSPDGDPTHAYAHTAGIQKGPGTLEKGKSTGAQAVKDNITDNANKDTLSTSPSDADLQAVHVGDQYIEFTFDVDESNPNLVKMKEPEATSNHLRPTPPARDPPSLHSSRPPSPLPKTSRSPSPFLEPQTSPINSPKDSVGNSDFYDYADPNRLSPCLGRRSPNRPASPVADRRDIEADDHPPYDYADVSDGDDDGTRVDRIESVYEDVEKKLREASMKKHRSDTDMEYSLEGYEVPVTGQTRPVSSPDSGTSSQGDYKNTIANLRNALKTPPSSAHEAPEYKNINTNKRVPLKPQNVTQGKEKVVPNLTSELQSKLLKTREKQVKPSNKPSKVKDAKRTVGDNHPGVIKSDNISTKDYEKVPDKKSVLNMAKVFEQK